MKKDKPFSLGIAVRMFCMLMAGISLMLTACPPPNKTGDTTAPAEVSNLSAVPGNASVALSWTDPEDEDFDHVEITHDQTGGDTAKTVEAGVKTYTWDNLKNDTAYTFTVKTVDADDNTSEGITKTATPATISYTTETSEGTMKIVIDGSNYILYIDDVEKSKGTVTSTTEAGLTLTSEGAATITLAVSDEGSIDSFEAIGGDAGDINTAVGTVGEDDGDGIPSELIGTWYSEIDPDTYTLEFTEEGICNLTGAGAGGSGLVATISGNSIDLAMTYSGASVSVVKFDYAISNDVLTLSNITGSLATTFGLMGDFTKTKPESEPIPEELLGTWYSKAFPEDYNLEFTSESICNFTGTSVSNATGMSVETSGSTLSLTATISGQKVPMVSFDYSISGDELSISNATGTLANSFNLIAPFKKGPYIPPLWDGETVRQLNLNVWSSRLTAEYIDDDTYTWYKFTPSSDGTYYIHADVTVGGLALPIVYTEDGIEVPQGGGGGSWSSGIGNYDCMSYSLTANITYYIALQPKGSSYSSTTFTVAVNQTIAPPGATTLTLDTWSEEATIEYASTSHNSYYTWYSFTPTSDGTYYIHADVTDGYLLFPILHTADSLIGGIASGWQGGKGYSSCSLTANTTYYIALRPDAEYNSPATFVLAVNQTIAPSGATTLALDTWSEEVTREYAFYTYTWYKFEPSSNGTYYIHAHATVGGLNSAIVYTADNNTIDYIDSEWSYGTSQGYNSYNLDAETTYYIAIQPGNGYSPATFTVTVNQSSTAPE
ncbi:MAG: fibronectin type III domain-containing protein [Spirochaetaceae bacterium]|jgi:hypothetical protein|nr:fibronectin type III domain-containing protein [Spirochaetaceae bacterium]